MTHLILVRGLPGSGKSTYAKSTGYKHFEADMFFEHSAGYRFDAKLLPFAHQWCLANTACSLFAGSDTVVSNTFTQLWEMEKYLELADLIPDVSISIVEVYNQFQNIHDVPQASLDRMKARWEPLPADAGVVLSGTFPDEKTRYYDCPGDCAKLLRRSRRS